MKRVKFHIPLSGFSEEHKVQVVRQDKVIKDILFAIERAFSSAILSGVESWLSTGESRGASVGRVRK